MDNLLQPDAPVEILSPAPDAGAPEGFAEGGMQVLADTQPELLGTEPAPEGEGAGEPGGTAPAEPDQFTPVVISGYGIEDDIRFETRDEYENALREVKLQRNWRSHLDARSQELAAYERSLRESPEVRLIERIRSLDPRASAVVQDILAGGLPPEVAIQRAQLLTGTQSQQLPPEPGAEPDPDDLPAHLQWELRLTRYENARALAELRGALAPQQPSYAPQQPQAQPPTAPQGPSPAEAQIYAASNGTMEAAMREWTDEFKSSVGLDLFDQNNLPAQRFMARVREVLDRHRVNPFRQVFTKEMWEQAFTEAVPRLAAERTKAKLARRPQTPQGGATPPARGRGTGAQSPYGTGEGIDWFGSFKSSGQHTR